MTVLQATALSKEVLAMPDGEDTTLESHRSRLSGSQQQRLTTIRAVSLQRITAILEDVFSGLDNTNARTIS